MKTIICDIDGTLADLNHRLHYISGKKKDYDSFYGEVSNDKPIQPTIEVIKAMHLQCYSVVYVTGRRASCYDDTKEWLDMYNLPHGSLYTRKDGDYRLDTVVKKEIYNKHLRDLDIFCVFDDRPGVVKMWRKLGLFVFDVNHRGEF